MKTSDLINQVADVAGIEKAQAKKAVEAVFSGITAAAKQGAEVSLPGFGKFYGGRRSSKSTFRVPTGQPHPQQVSAWPRYTQQPHTA